MRYTLAGVAPDNGHTPLHVESVEDGNALIDASGEDVTYSYLDLSDLGLGLFWRAGLQDKQTHRERRLSFAFLQRRLGLVRAPYLMVYPLMRLVGEHKLAETDIDKSIAPWPGVPRTLDYLTQFTADEEATRIKQLIARDSVDVAYLLTPFCFSHAEAACATAAVDKLLPLAEQHLAQPMILLAYAGANGPGIKSDESAAKVLLQGAARNEEVGTVCAAYFDRNAWHVAAATNAIPNKASAQRSRLPPRIPAQAGSIPWPPARPSPATAAPPQAPSKRRSPRQIQIPIWART